MKIPTREEWKALVVEHGYKRAVTLVDCDLDDVPGIEETWLENFQRLEPGFKKSAKEFLEEMRRLRPMSEAPRDGRTIIGVRKPARTPALQTMRRWNEPRIGWKGTYWVNRSTQGNYHDDDDFVGWKPE